MAGHKTTDSILRQVEELSFSDRMKLVESIVRSVRLSEDHRSGETADTPESLFGMRRDRGVILSGIREKAWRRPLSFLRHKRPGHGKTTIDKTMQYFPDSDVLHIVIREGPEARCQGPSYSPPSGETAFVEFVEQGLASEAVDLCPMTSRR